MLQTRFRNHGLGIYSSVAYNQMTYSHGIYNMDNRTEYFLGLFYQTRKAFRFEAEFSPINVQYRYMQQFGFNYNVIQIAYMNLFSFATGYSIVKRNPLSRFGIDVNLSLGAEVGNGKVYDNCSYPSTSWFIVYYSTTGTSRSYLQHLTTFGYRIKLSTSLNINPKIAFFTDLGYGYAFPTKIKELNKVYEGSPFYLPSTRTDKSTLRFGVGIRWLF